MSFVNIQHAHKYIHRKTIHILKKIHSFYLNHLYRFKEILVHKICYSSFNLFKPVFKQVEENILKDISSIWYEQ